MKTRRNMWPFGTNQPLGPRVSYGKRRAASAGRTRASSPAQEKAAAAAKRAAKLDDPAIEKKLMAWYAKGGTLNSFLQANPGAREWVKRNTAYQDRLAKRLGAPHLSEYMPSESPAQRLAQQEREGRRQFPGLLGKTAGLTPSQMRAYKKRLKERGNPSAAAADVYEEFHGMPSTEIVEVTKRVHFHEHLAALGKLEALVVLRGGAEHRLVGFKGAKLCCNERKNQLFVEGGDQALDSKDFGFGRSWPHEKNTLGVVTRLEYFTTKKHLGKEGGTAIYFHLPAEPERGRSAGTGPDLIYDAVNESLEFAGGTYEILAEGISR